jgi:hypothetical protein
MISRTPVMIASMMVREINSSLPAAANPTTTPNDKAATVELGPTFRCLEVPKMA